MSWSELERLVETAERDPSIARALGHCRSAAELVLAARRLGFGVSAADLGEARALAQGLPPGKAARTRAGGAQLFPTPRQRIRPGGDSTATPAIPTILSRPGDAPAVTVNHSLAS